MGGEDTEATCRRPDGVQNKIDLSMAEAESGKRAKEQVMVNMGVEPRTLALLAPRSKPTELIDRCLFMSSAVSANVM